MSKEEQLGYIEECHKKRILEREKREAEASGSDVRPIKFIVDSPESECSKSEGFFKEGDDLYDFFEGMNRIEVFDWLFEVKDDEEDDKEEKDDQG
jgi:hypothetical protein